MPAKRPHPAFEAAVHALLAPVAEYARTQGIGPRQFARIVADAAQRRPPSDEPALPYDAAVRLVSRWTMDGSYSSRGKPRRLPLSGKGSFAGLVRAVRAGSPATALAALERVGIVRRDRRGVRLLQTAYVPGSGESERIDILGRAAGEFMRVLTHNLSVPADDRFLQRVASYDNIGSSSLMTLRKALRREGMRALERANTLLASRDRDRNRRAPGGRRTRVSFGVYVLAEAAVAAARRRRG